MLETNNPRLHQQRLVTRLMLAHELYLSDVTTRYRATLDDCPAETDVFPRFPGSYKIEVTQGARPVRGSPYYCQVFDASKVKLDSVGAKAVAVSEDIAFKRESDGNLMSPAMSVMLNTVT
jgi:hypothetical protein